MNRRDLISIFIHAVFFVGCILGADPVVVSGGPENDYESWIARSGDGRLMVVFCRNPDWASGDLYVTFSTDDGNTWDTPVPIIVQAGDQATLSFVRMPGGMLRLWYASNEGGEYNIYSAHSMNGIDWTLDGRTELGWLPQERYYDPTVIVEPDSSLTMAYRGADGAYVAHRLSDGPWDTLRIQVAAGGFRPRIMKHHNGTYLFAYHRNIGGGQYEVHVKTSTDLTHWSTETVLTSQGNSHDPFVNATPDSGYLIYYATYATPAYNLFCRRSYDAINWESEDQVTSDAYWNTQPHFFIESNTIYLVWAHATTPAGDTYDVYFERTPYSVGTREARHTAPGIFSMQPVPCRDVLRLTLGIQKATATDIAVYDIAGKEIMMWNQPQSAGCRDIVLNTSILAPGTYFLRVRSDQGQHIDKFIVLR